MIGLISCHAGQQWEVRHGPYVTKGSHSFTCHPHTDHSFVCTPQSQGNRPLTGTKLYSLVTEAHRCEKLAQSFYAVVPGWDSNPRLLGRKSDTLPQRHDATSVHLRCLCPNRWYMFISVMHDDDLPVLCAECRPRRPELRIVSAQWSYVLRASNAECDRWQEWRLNFCTQIRSHNNLHSLPQHTHTRICSQYTP